MRYAIAESTRCYKLSESEVVGCLPNNASLIYYGFSRPHYRHHLIFTVTINIPHIGKFFKCRYLYNSADYTQSSIYISTIWNRVSFKEVRLHSVYQRQTLNVVVSRNNRKSWYWPIFQYNLEDDHDTLSCLPLLLVIYIFFWFDDITNLLSSDVFFSSMNSCSLIRRGYKKNPRLWIYLGNR